MTGDISSTAYLGYAIPGKPVSETGMYFSHRSQSIQNLAGALAAAQKNFAPVPKDREVTVRTRTGGNYTFKYATLDAIRAATMPALADQGLALSQRLIERGEQRWGVETTLYHASGEWLSNVTPMVLESRGEDRKPGNQELGAAQTYARRYGISALLCVTADEDDDIQNAEEFPNDSRATPQESFLKGKIKRDKNGVPVNFVDAAREDGTLDETRVKGTLAKKTAPAVAPSEKTAAAAELTVTPASEKPAAKKSPAEKGKEWTDKAIVTLNLGDNTVESLSAFWAKCTVQIQYLEENLPEQYERFMTAYNNAVEAAQAKTQTGEAQT